MNQKTFRRQKSIKILILQNEFEFLFYLKHSVRENKTAITFPCLIFCFVGNTMVFQQTVQAYAFQDATVFMETFLSQLSADMHMGIAAACRARRNHQVTKQPPPHQQVSTHRLSRSLQTKL